MPNGRISKRSVDALVCPPGKDRVALWDDDLAGFGIVAFPSGLKSYVVQYRQNGKSRRANIGKHGRMTPDEARSEAKKVLGGGETGVDPIADKKAARGGITLREAAEGYLERHVVPKKKLRTADEYRRLLEKRIVPKLGGKRLVDIRHPDVIALHLEISKDNPVRANRAAMVLSALWGWSGSYFSNDGQVVTAEDAECWRRAIARALACLRGETSPKNDEQMKIIETYGDRAEALFRRFINMGCNEMILL